MYRMYDMIMKKRSGAEHTADEIRFIVEGFTKGEIPDYQMSAWLMCVYYKGMTHDETCALTHAMAQSGDQLSLAAIHGVKVDKHSTGGVGDKTTFIVAPILASLGVPVAKMSGRGLGHTGGTIDKLEAIPGFCVSIPETEFIEHVNSMKLALVGQTGDLAPADKKIYALRDVTATVDSLPLIASSIMSKKLAAGADRILLDVKTGSGAFMKTFDASVELAREMVEIGRSAGRHTAALVSNMDVPLGNCVGNALETMEAIEVLKGEGPEDLRDFCVFVSACMLHLADVDALEACRRIAREQLNSGAALGKLRAMIETQGGDVRVLEDASLFGTPALVHTVKAPQSGYIAHMQTDRIGMAGVLLGAGRRTKDQPIDYRAGIVLCAKTGDRVLAGQPLAELHTNLGEQAAGDAQAEFLAALQFAPTPPPAQKLVLAHVDERGVTHY